METINERAEDDMDVINNLLDGQYQDLISNILENGREKESGRENMPNTIGISNAAIKMDLSDGFPLLTTKKMHYKGIFHELLWFLHGDTNIKYLVDNKVNIWNGDAYRWYLKHVETLEEPDYDFLVDDPVENKTRPFTMEEFIDRIKSNEAVPNNNLPTKKRIFKIDVGDIKEDDIEDYIQKVANTFKKSVDFPDVDYKIEEIKTTASKTYSLGDLGKVYGYQWRNQNGVDQIKDVYEGLLKNPYSRYHIIDGWNRADFKDMALPPCHLLYQFIVRPLTLDERRAYFNSHMGGNLDQVKGDNYENDSVDALDSMGCPKFYLDLNMYQRSCDTGLGVPYNLASMSLLLMIFAKATNMIAGEATWIGGDTHLYVNHVNTILEQLDREPFNLPKLTINKELNSLEDIMKLSIDDFVLEGYKSHPALKFELFTGLKKK